MNDSTINKNIDPLEAALTEHSCALACLVSLCREFRDGPIGQRELIDSNMDSFPDWKTTPGSLTPYQFISFSRHLLQSKAHIWVEYPDWIKKYWAKVERIGAIIISQQQPVGLNQTQAIQHGWRVLDVGDNGMSLMNPTMPKAEKVDVDWLFLKEWKAYALFIER